MSNNIRSQAILTYLSANRFGSFSFSFNSTTNSRGVGIIYSNSLNMKIHREIRDPDENFLILDTEINSLKLTLGAVYLPSKIENKEMHNLISCIDHIDNHYKVIGGDYNLTPSDAPAELNKDLYNHNGCNIKASNILSEWMIKSNLVEPYRTNYPSSREFSFKSGIGSLASRSRIDFFVISVELLKIMKNIEYLPTPSPMFDHKAVLLDFRNISKMPYRIFISDSTIDNDECIRITKLAFVNMIEQYWVGTFDANNHETILQLNEINATIHGLRKYTSYNFDALLNTMLETNLKRFDEIYHSIEFSQLLEPWQLSITPPLALEMLLNDAKMHISELSRLETVSKRSKKDKLMNKLNEVKKNPDYDGNLVDEIENKLQTLIDNSPGILSRKPTLSYVDLNKGNTSYVSKVLNKIDPKGLEDLLNNGHEFRGKEDRNDYIFNYYADIYSKVPTTTSSVEDFMNSNGNSLPTPNHDEGFFTSLICDISAQELTEVISDQNFRGSPGLDQVPASLIKKVAPAIFPLILLAFNFVLHGLGDFSLSTKAAKVRLIPKNDKSSEIRNWRPITLTNCLFKLYSKILSKRLALLLPKILGKPQKAYLRHQIISEATANLLEYIENNKNSNIPSFLVSLDFTKAFDSLSHNSIIQTLSFFGFPEEFIAIVRSWLSNRKSCIILGKNELSKFFPVLVGVPQGDPLSGYLFILTIELLLLKLDSFPQMKPLGTLVKNIAPLTTEGFADDVINLLRCCTHTLRKYKDIIIEFGNASNLKLNMLKSKLLIVGNNTNEAAEIANECGFQVNSSLTHLGVIIDNKLENLMVNWDNKIKKTNSLKNLLLSLNLNLVTKISICKTFLYSQFAYLAPVLPPSPVHVKNIKKVILSFLYPRKNSFSAERTFSSRDEAGLDLAPVGDFIDSITLNFALRSRYSEQPWATALREFFVNRNTQCALSGEELQGFNLKRYALLINLFNKNFYLTVSSVWNSPIFNSCSITDPETNTYLPIPHTIRGTLLANATVGGIYNFSENRIMTSYEIGNKLGIFMNHELRGAILRALPPRNHRPTTRPLPKSLTFFLAKKTKAKSLRRIISKSHTTLNLSQTLTLLNSYVVGPTSLKKQIENLNTWSISFIPYCVKHFALFHLNMKIILNDRRYKFQNTISECSFCIRFPTTGKVPHETFKHFYFECPVSEPIRSKYFPDLLTFPIDIKEVTTRGSQLTHPTSMIINIEVLLFCYFLYSCKLSKTLPTYNNFLLCSYTLKKCMLRTSIQFEKAYTGVSINYGSNIHCLNNSWLERV